MTNYNKKYTGSYRRYMDITLFRSVFDKSGFSKSELAYIYQVSRQTLYTWYRGEAAPQAGVEQRATTYTAALAKSISSGVLPLSRNIPKDVRKQNLLTIATKLHDLIKPTQPR